MTRHVTIPQIAYRPVKEGFLIESIVYGDHQSKYRQFVNYITSAETEGEAIALCERMRRNVYDSPEARREMIP